jgi:hypothetical protein
LYIAGWFKPNIDEATHDFFRERRIACMLMPGLATEHVQTHDTHAHGPLSREYAARETLGAEIQIRIAVLNRYTALGIPVTEPIG